MTAPRKAGSVPLSRSRNPASAAATWGKLPSPPMDTTGDLGHRLGCFQATSGHHVRVRVRIR
jgi:hypothetical protein